MTAVQDLARAAAAWESAPAWPAYAAQMEAAAKAVAGELGVTVSLLREEISAHRAYGLDIDQAVEAAVDALGKEHQWT